MRYFTARKTAATIIKQSKEKSWEEFGQKLDADNRSPNKVCAWKTISRFRGKRTPVATFIKDTNSVLQKHQEGILNRWREYFCELLNPVTAQHLEASEEKIGDKIHLTEAKVRTAIKSLKTGKAFGKDECHEHIGGFLADSYTPSSLENW